MSNDELLKMISAVFQMDNKNDAAQYITNNLVTEDKVVTETISHDDQYKILYVNEKPTNRLLTKIIFIDGDIHSVTNLTYSGDLITKYYYIYFVNNTVGICYLYTDNAGSVIELNYHTTGKVEETIHPNSYLTADGVCKKHTSQPYIITV